MDKCRLVSDRDSVPNTDAESITNAYIDLNANTNGDTFTDSTRNCHRGAVCFTHIDLNCHGDRSTNRLTNRGSNERAIWREHSSGDT